MSESFQPYITPPQSSIASTRTPLWSGKRSHQEIERNNIRERSNVIDRGYSYNLPHRTNQTSVIKYEKNQRGLFMQQEMKTSKEIETETESFYKTRNNFCITSLSNEIKQEQTSFDEGNTSYESYLPSTQYCQKMFPAFMSPPEQGFSRVNLSNFSPMYQQTSVIKRTPEASPHKSNTHNIVNFNQHTWKHHCLVKTVQNVSKVDLLKPIM